MYRSIWIIFVTISIVMISLSGQREENFDEKLHSLIKHRVPLITVQELKEDLSRNFHMILLDTREIEEFKVSHIKSARYVGYKDFILKSINDIPKEAPIVVYCSLGVRSEKVGEKLQKLGYKKVKNLLGGIFEWVNQGNTVYDMNNQLTQRVHAFSKKWAKWLFEGEKVF